MSLQLLSAVKQDAEIYLADPVSGNPSAPPGATQANVNQLWQWATWIVIVMAALVALGALATAMWQHQSGRPNDGFGKLGVVLACAIGIGSIAAVIGKLTGT